MMGVVTKNVHGYLMEVNLPEETTELEKVELLHKWWKEKQDAVPESPDDILIYMDPYGTQVKRTRSQGRPKNPLFKCINEVKFTLGEAEKNAKGGE